MLTKTQVKYIQSLNEKKFRNAEGVFVAEGPKLINELLESPNVEPLALYGTDEWWLKNKALQNNLPFVAFYNISASELERISFLATPHQVLGLFKKPLFSPELLLDGTITLVLDGIQDPGNAGTILRTADWFGIKQVIAGKDTADIFNPKVVQSTMGSIARVKVMYEDIADVIGKFAHIPVYASTLNGRPLPEFGKVSEGMLLIGNESKGIKDELLRLSAYRITIPKSGYAESLNAAVAAGIILSHIV